MESDQTDISSLPFTDYLHFVGETEPETFAALARSILALIDGAWSEVGAGFSAEDREALQGLRRELAEAKFDSMTHFERPHLVITPQELAWLDRHPQPIWLEYLIHRYKFKLYPVQRKLAKFPPYLLIEPTSACNLRCVMCFQVDKSFSSNRQYMGMMPWGLFTSVVDQAADNKCHAITLASRGEPTLHRRFGEMLGYIHGKGILDTKINTNATRLTEKMAHDILDADVSTVTFSVDASNKETFERIRVGAKFEKVLENIERFNKIRATEYPGSGTTTRISGVAVENTQKPEEMKRFWSNYVDHVAIVPMIPRWDSYGNLPFRRQSVCGLLYERLYVWFDGVCNPCDFDYKSLLAVGNAHEQPISDIWLGEKYQRLRQLHEAKKRSSISPCDRCPF